MSGRSQVTITLGRSGQVVKRDGVVSENDHSDIGPSAGAKRRIRDRLGNSSDWEDPSQNKRPRREGHKWNDDDISDERQYKSNHPIGQNDLRFKLMHKSSTRTRMDAGRQNDLDLREKLSRSNGVPLRFNTRERVSESKPSDPLRRIPATRSADDLLQMDSHRKSYTAWTLDGRRHRSPDRLLSSSRARSPPRTIEDLRQVPSLRSIDPSRSAPFITKSGIDSRPAPFMTKAAVPVESSKPIMRLPPPSHALPKSTYTSEEPLSVSGLLSSLGLGKYAITFQAEEVDMAALKQMSDNDLKELGIPMGPRKKILLAVAPHSKQRRPLQ